MSNDKGYLISDDVDRLAHVRQKIKAFQVLEKQLKESIAEDMKNGDSLSGVRYIAYQTIAERKGSIDIQLLEQAGLDVDSYRKPSSAHITLRLEERERDDG